MRNERSKNWIAAGLAAVLASAGCASHKTADSTPRPAPRATSYETTHDKTVKGAGIGAAAGAATALIAGKRQADQILIGAGIGAAAGAGVGAYMDAQEEKLARIPGTTVQRVEPDLLLLHFDSDILFPPNSTTLGHRAEDTVEHVAEVLAQYKKTAVVVQGHTDATGTASHNQWLSERRAETVGGALVARGVEPRRLATEGYGETMPVASNSSERGRSANRRVEILLKTR
jgi:outer membrane protein OmpA-like peptidoglycan-associated protein